jgi:phosphopantetheine adenylyltransferase
MTSIDKAITGPIKDVDLNGSLDLVNAGFKYGRTYALHEILKASVFFNVNATLPALGKLVFNAVDGPVADGLEVKVHETDHPGRRAITVWNTITDKKAHLVIEYRLLKLPEIYAAENEATKDLSADDFASHMINEILADERNVFDPSHYQPNTEDSLAIRLEIFDGFRKMDFKSHKPGDYQASTVASASREDVYAADDELPYYFAPRTVGRINATLTGMHLVSQLIGANQEAVSMVKQRAQQMGNSSFECSSSTLDKEICSAGMKMILDTDGMVTDQTLDAYSREWRRSDAKDILHSFTSYFDEVVAMTEAHGFTSKDNAFDCYDLNNHVYLETGADQTRVVRIRDQNGSFSISDDGHQVYTVQKTTSSNPMAIIDANTGSARVVSDFNDKSISDNAVFMSALSIVHSCLMEDHGLPDAPKP